MECDTLDDIPEELCTLRFIDDMVFSKFREYVGPVFTGNANQAWCSSNKNLDWGRAIAINADETLQVRISPRGALSKGKIFNNENSTIMVAARRQSRGSCSDYVAFAVLWTPRQDAFAQNERARPFNPLKETSQPVATRNLHIVVPSLFNHHDAQVGPTRKSGKVTPQWPVLDESNYHAVRPSSFTIHRPVRLPTGEQILTATASTGVSQFVIAGQLAGVDVEDPPHRSSEPLAYHKWGEMVDKYSDTLIHQLGPDIAYSAMVNSLAFTDMLTCEGFLGLLGHTFAHGAMPDMMHSPGGFPLLIAFAVRLACYPKRFGLVSGSEADQLANREIISLFESNWEAISPEQAGGRNVYVIDLAMKRALTEGGASAKRADSSQNVDDNLLFWYRCGQRCVTSVFGPQLQDFLPLHSDFGLCEKVVDPLMEARNRVLQSQMDPAAAVANGDASMLVSFTTIAEKRNILLMVLSSVEHWLRSGEYCGMQISKANESHVQLRIKRGNGKKKILSKEELRDALIQGAEESVAEMVASGEAETEEDARRAATLLRENLYAAVESSGDCHGLDDHCIDFNDLNLKIPRRLADTMGMPILNEPTGDHYDKLDKENICLEALSNGVSAIAASMCTGPMVHHQFEMGTFLSSPVAATQCADCDVPVHLLSAAFCSSSAGRCPACHRARCNECATRAYERKLSSRESSPTKAHCKRCKPDKRDEQQPASPPPVAVVQGPAKGSRKKNRGAK